MTLTTLLFAFLVVQAGPVLSAERTRTAELLAWYDTLGFPDTAGRPYVRVTTGWWSKVGNGAPENRYVEGFLLREDAASFTVFISGVSTLGIAGNSGILEPPRTPLNVFRFVRIPDGPEHERVLYERIDLAARARCA